MAHGGHGGGGGGGVGHGGFPGPDYGFVGPVVVMPAPGGRVQEVKYCIKAVVGVYLSGDEATAPSPGPFGRIAQQVVGLRHETASLAPEGFLERASSFLGFVQLRNVLLVKYDRMKAFEADEQSRESNSDNMQTAFLKSLVFQRNVGEPFRDVSVVAHGFVPDFELQTALVFKLVHSVAKPSVTLYVLALPVELMRKDGEEKLDYMDRVRLLLDDAEFFKGLEASVKPKIESLLSEYEEKLRATFSVINITRELTIDVRRMVPV